MSGKQGNLVGIREAGIAEAALLLSLHDQCFPDPSSLQSMSEILAMAGAFALAAVRGDDGRAIGFAIGRVAADEGELLLLGVLAPERRHGVAAALLRQVIERARAQGCRHLFLEVAETNRAAQALYREHGFTVVGRRPDYYCSAGRPPVAALTLCRAIRSLTWRWFGLRKLL